MKLNKNITKNITILLFIIVVSLYNCFIQNGLEKLFHETYFDGFNFIKRPLEKCLNSRQAHCIGMPSGHSETITIFASLLYLYKFIPLWLCILAISIVGLQRILTNVHTILQVLTGIFLGYMYSKLYRYFNLSIFSFLIVLFIGLILSLLIIYKIDKQVYGPVPRWVDTEMIESIKKKQSSPLYTKIGSIYINAAVQGTTFMSWKHLEDKLDIIIDRIKQSGQNYDAVVGIKTGGAIISDYISMKLGLPNYKIKISRSEYNCNKKPNDVLNEMVQKHVLKKLGKFTVCEGINDNLQGKNIILVDELVSTGKTMFEAYEYLKSEKHVNNIYPTSVSLYKKLYKSDLNIDYVVEGTILVWPWGYDN
jgi:hypoxanthine phosphoribosyltransferase